MELHRTTGRAGLGFAFALTTMLLWGMLPHALKIVLRDLDAATIIWFRLALSALLLGAVLTRRGTLPRLRELSRTGWVLLVVATLFLATNYFAFLVGLDFTGSSNAQVLIQLAHLLLALGGIAVFGERFTPGQWFGFAVLVSGMGLFFGSRLLAGTSDTPHYVLGSLWIVGSAVAWAVYGLAQKQLLRWLPAQSIMLCIYAGCALLFLPAARPADVLRMGALPLGVLVFCGLNTLIAYGAFAEALVHWEASRVSAVLALSPLATLGFGALGELLLPGLVIAEPIAPSALLGAAVVVCGSLVVALGAGRTAAQTPVADTGPADARRIA